MALTRRDDLEARKGVDVGRLAKEGAGSLVYTLAVLVALGLALAVAIRFRWTHDFSKRHENSLSQKTEEALASLPAAVKIWALFKDRDPAREGYWDLLQSYKHRSDRIEAEFVDPNSRPGIVTSLGLSREEQSALKEGLSVATCGTRKVVFRGRDEEAVTNAVLEVGSEQHRTLGIVRGIGERDPASSGDDGMKAAVDALRGEYYDVSDVSLDRPIPADVTVLLVAGPRAVIPKADLARLATWLEAGGRLLVLADGDFDSGIGEVTATWGLRSRDVRILDRRQNLRTQPEVPLMTSFSRHPIVRGFSAALPIALPLPVPVEDFDPRDPTLFHETIAKTSGTSEAIGASGNREAGPFGVAAASFKTVGTGAAAAGETRVVLIGDVAFATNAFLPEQANRDFFLNSVGWLSRARGFISVRGHVLAGQQIAIRSRDVRIFRLLLVGPPFLIALAGVVVFVRRRGL